MAAVCRTGSFGAAPHKRKHSQPVLDPPTAGTAKCTKMLSLKCCTLAGLLLLCVVLQSHCATAAPTPVPGQTNTPDTATLTMQFDNSKKAVLDSTKRQLVINTLAKYVFLCPPSQVTLVSGIDQSGLLTSQSVASFRAVGPSTNGKTVLQNCKDNTAGRWLGLRDSVAQSEVKKATDTWWPNDKVDIQKADCTA